MIDGLNLATPVVPLAAAPAVAPAGEIGFAGLLAAALPVVPAPGAVRPVSTATGDAAGEIFPVPVWPLGVATPVLPADSLSAPADALVPDAEVSLDPGPATVSPGGMATGAPPRRPVPVIMLTLAPPTIPAKPGARPVPAANAEDAPPAVPLTGPVPLFDVLAVPAMLAADAPVATDIVASAAPAGSSGPLTMDAPWLVPRKPAWEGDRPLPGSHTTTVQAGPVSPLPAPPVPKIAVSPPCDAAPAPPPSISAAMALDATPPLVAAEDLLPPVTPIAAPTPLVAPTPIAAPTPAVSGAPAPVAALPAHPASVAMTPTPSRREPRVRPDVEALAAVASPALPAPTMMTPDRVAAPSVGAPDTAPSRTAEPGPAVTVATAALGDVRIGLDGGPGDLRVSLGVAPGGAAIIMADAARLAGDLAASGIRLQSLDVGSGGAGQGEPRDPRPRHAPASPIAARAFAADTPDRSPTAADRYA